MSTALIAVPGEQLEAQPDTALDAGFLQSLGWDPATGLLSPPPNHPTLPWTPCAKAGCAGIAASDSPLSSRVRLCRTCLAAAPKEDDALRAWLRIPRETPSTLAADRDCAVSKCERPRENANGLCATHGAECKAKGMPVEEYIACPDTRPYASYGDCRVASCHRRAANKARLLCTPHRRRWAEAQKADPSLQLDDWVLSAAPVTSGVIVSLRGLPDGLRADLLFAVQERCRSGNRIPLWALRNIVQTCRESGCESLLDVPVPDKRYRSGGDYDFSILSEMKLLLRTAQSTPEVEALNDVWNLRVWGLSGNLNFTTISQRWLRETAKHWAQEEIPRRRGPQAGTLIGTFVKRFALLSESLRLSREDGGANCAVLGRPDIVSLTTWFGLRVETGEMSERSRWLALSQMRRLLGDCRDYGLTKPGRAMFGLPDDFAVTRRDVPPPPDDEDDVGRALPDRVIEILLERLPTMDDIAGNRSARVASELIMRTGRRPDEVCALPSTGCLRLAADGGWNLVYTDFKNNRADRELQIRSEDVALIHAQQKWVRETFPDVDPTKLPLFPRASRNAHGSHRITQNSLYSTHKKWVDTMPPIMVTGPDGKPFEFDKTNIFPYAYRHTYAQRHADNGTPVDVLRELMGHKDINTTQTYYRVNEKRRRDAVNALIPWQINARGSSTWTGGTVDEASAHRYAVGHVTTALGTCHEPSNVEAGGGSCPYRMRCLGCGHFRTDPSYLPELRAHLDGLLRDRERILATNELTDWAKADATPRDEEIETTRRLIREQEERLTALPPEAQAEITEASTTVRRQRQLVALGLPGRRPGA